MSLFNKKKKQPKPEKKEFKQYISGAGGSVVTRSLLEGKSKLKWLFREDSGLGNGWVAFGDSDSQEYVNNAENLTVVDFNTLANIEPAVLNVFFMPVGTDLELRSDESGKYFIDTKTGREIREPVPNPIQEAFMKNRKFLNQESYPVTFFRHLFQKDKTMETFLVGEADFPSGEVVLADPLSYLGQEKYETHLERRIPVGSYPVELSIFRSSIAGLRIAAAKLKLSDKEPVTYEIAMPRGKTKEDFGSPGIFTFFGVDAGMACFADTVTSQEYYRFVTEWYKANQGKNIYDDYFAGLLQKSYEEHPEVQRSGGDFLCWKIPEKEYHLVLFASGMGDGIYSGYWGLDADGEAVELVIPFLNPEFF